MAWLQNRNDSWRVLFRYDGRQHTLWLGDVDEREAQSFAAKVDYWVMRLKQQLVSLPPGCDVVTFVQHDGKPPSYSVSKAKELTLSGLRKAYLKSQGRKLEATTLSAISLHFNHLVRILGPERLIPTLLRGDLQAYADKRSSEWIDPNVYRIKRREKEATKKPRKNRKPPPAKADDKPRRHPSSATVKKEIVSLRTAWNWARRHLGLTEEFPGGGLDHVKTEESLPFMTWEEAERRSADTDDAKKIWSCVYLRPDEITELLKRIKDRPISPAVYPMFVFAAFTGARRSEIVRVLPSDVDLAGGAVTLREKKRDKNRLTTRRVPLTPFLKEVLADWLKARAKGATLFCKRNGTAITPREAHNYFQRGLHLSKWSVLKGWHVFRHSFISALASKGIDQRIIDEIAGHQTDEQRRRYRHLYPNVIQDAVSKAFS